ncbi:MAG: ABC transporter ATP-binding protein [Candidatus Parcubacteria bacterium]|nr:ABC transporter ATP-binding protein [Candidatus Parcubacteria bacterium]
MAQQPLIKLVALDKDYVNDEVVTHVLKSIDLNIGQGEFVAIMGPSGSGKSTLMHVLGFLDKATSGKYYFKGIDVSNLEDDQLAEIRNEEVGFIFQAFNLLQRTSVFDNVRLPLLYSKKKVNKENVIAAIKSVGLYHRLNNLSNQLSGGEKQRVAIARALVNQPSIIFADEPTGNLDSKTGKQIMEILQDLNEEGKTIILVTHEKYTAEHARRIIKIIDGEIQDDYEVKERLIAKNEKKLIK